MPLSNVWAQRGAASQGGGGQMVAPGVTPAYGGGFAVNATVSTDASAQVTGILVIVLLVAVLIGDRVLR